MKAPFIYSKNIQFKKSGSFENDPIWVKYASINVFTGDTRVNFRTKCVTQNSGRGRKQDGGTWKERETDQGLLLGNYSHHES